MDFEKYKNNAPYPGAAREDVNIIRQAGNLSGNLAAAVTHVVEDAKARVEIKRAQRRAWQAEQSRLDELFKRDALEEVGLTGHPKADKAFSLAWEHGHSSGHSDVMCHLEELAELLVG